MNPESLTYSPLKNGMPRSQTLEEWAARRPAMSAGPSSTASSSSPTAAPADPAGTSSPPSSASGKTDGLTDDEVTRVWEGIRNAIAISLALLGMVAFGIYLAYLLRL